MSTLKVYSSGRGGPTQAPTPQDTAAASQAQTLDLREMGRILWRRKVSIIGTVVVLSVLAYLIITQLTPLYTGKTYVMIEGRETTLATDVEAVLSGISADSQTMESEIQIISSRGLATKTVDKLRLDRDPEFNRALRPPSTMAMLLNWRSYVPKSWIEEIFGPQVQDSKVARSEQEEADRLRASLASVFVSKLEVTPQGKSRVIEVAVTTERPQTAALVANTLADFYIVSQLDAKFEATKRANSWLSERIAELRRQVETAEQAVETFRATSGLTQANADTTLAQQEIADFGGRLVDERTRRVEAEARLRQVQNLLSSGETVDATVDVLNSDAVRDLRGQSVEIERRIAEFSSEYGEKHPVMVNARAELADIRAKVDLEVNRVIQGLRNEVAVARAREATLASAVEERKREMGALSSAEVQLRALEREAEASRVLLETFLVRSKETTSQQDFQQPDAAILSYADVPQSPSYPKKNILMLLSIGGALCLGVLLAFALELLDQGFRSMEQVEQIMGVTPLGLIPSLKGTWKLGATPENYVIKKPKSAYSEAIRSLHTSLLLSDVDKTPKVVLIASSLPREGKTATAVSLATMQAKVGQDVVLVDCDLRRPSIHKILGVSSRPGVVECLAGEVSLDEALKIDPRSGATVLTAGAPSADPPDLLASPQMRKLLTDLAERFDLVVVDSAPTMAVSDTRVLSRLVDKTVFVVRWAHTRREVAIAGLRQVLEAGSDVAGVLLTMVDVKEHAHYGFSDSGYYTGPIKKYYSG